MLRGETARARNKRFARMPKKRDEKFSSRGAGVVYEPVRTSRRKYYAMQLERVAREAVSNYEPETRLIKRG